MTGRRGATSGARRKIEEKIGASEKCNRNPRALDCGAPGSLTPLTIEVTWRQITAARSTKGKNILVQLPFGAPCFHMMVRRSATIGLDRTGFKGSYLPFVVICERPNMQEQPH